MRMTLFFFFLGPAFADGWHRCTNTETDLREAEVEDVGVQFAQRPGEAVPAEVLSAELTEENPNKQPSSLARRDCSRGRVESGLVLPVAEPFGQVDVQDMRQDGDELCGVAEGSTDGVSWVNVVQFCNKTDMITLIWNKLRRFHPSFPWIRGVSQNKKTFQWTGSV